MKDKDVVRCKVKTKIKVARKSDEANGRKEDEKAGIIVDAENG